MTRTFFFGGFVFRNYQWFVPAALIILSNFSSNSSIWLITSFALATNSLNFRFEALKPFIAISMKHICLASAFFSESLSFLYFSTSYRLAFASSFKYFTAVKRYPYFCVRSPTFSTTCSFAGTCPGKIWLDGVGKFDMVVFALQIKSKSKSKPKSKSNCHIIILSILFSLEFPKRFTHNTG